MTIAIPPAPQQATMEGWLFKRGPTADYKWMHRWCVITQQRFEYFADKDRLVRKGSIPLSKAARVVRFCLADGACNSKAPGDAVKHFRAKPHGFVLDLNPQAGNARHLLYFDAVDAAKLEAWIHSFELAVGLPVAAPICEAANLDEDEEDVPAQLGKLAKACSESKRCSQVGVQVAARRSSLAARRTSIAARRSSMQEATAIAQEHDESDKAALKRFSASGFSGRAIIAAGRRKSITLQVDCEVCGEESAGESTGTSSDESSSDEWSVRPTNRQEGLQAVQRNPQAYWQLSDDLRRDRDIVLAVVKEDPSALAYVPEQLRSDREVVLAAVQRDGKALRHSLKVLQADREIVLAAVMQHPGAIEFASPDLQADENLLIF